jgi:NADH-ubiquinone oxidoreductase chain 6
MLAFATLLSSVFSITSKNPVISVIFLISTFVSGAGYLILIGINFVGISYIIVYVGAIAVLFLFVIMMINIKLTDILETGSQYTKNLPLAIAIGSLFIFIIFSIIPFNFNNVPAISVFLDKITYLNTLLSNSSSSHAAAAATSNDLANNHLTATIFTSKAAASSDVIITDFQQIESLGYSLYTYGAILLITLSVILLLAMFATIVISKINNEENVHLYKDNINVTKNCSPTIAKTKPSSSFSSSSSSSFSSFNSLAANYKRLAAAASAAAGYKASSPWLALALTTSTSLLFIFVLLSFNSSSSLNAAALTLSSDYYKFDLLYIFKEFNFWLKLCFILFLFLINVILMFQDYYYYENVNKKYLEAGISNKLKDIFLTGGAGLGLISSYIAIKNEWVQKNLDLQKSPDKIIDKQTYAGSIDLDEKMQNNIIVILNDADFKKLANEKIKISFVQANSMLSECIAKTKALEQKAISGTSNLSDFIKFTEDLKKDITKIGTNLVTLEENLKTLILSEVTDKPQDPQVKIEAATSSNPNSNSNPATAVVFDKDIDKTKKSSILDLDFDWFESLGGIQKLAVSLLLLNSVLFSCLLNIIFIFYGNILINKFNLEVRYPNLAKIIKLRQLYTKYYLILNCLLILAIIIAQVVFSIAILLL